MADFTQAGNIRTLSYGFDLSNVTGTAITSGAINTKGSYIEIVSAANNIYESNEIEVIFDSVSAGIIDFLVDVAIGGSGSEEVIIPNIYTKTSSALASVTNEIKFKIAIPEGVRISIRCQASVATSAINSYIRLSSGNFRESTAFSEVVALGADTATSTGTLVTRAAAGVFGSWTTIEASTIDIYSGMAIASQRGGGSWSNGKLVFQVAIGSAGNEEIIIENIFLTTSSGETGCGLLSSNFGVDIAIGERLSIRAAASNANEDFDNDYVLYMLK